MSYTIRFIDGSKSVITDEEFKNLAGKTGLLYIPSVGEIVNLSSVSRIYPSDKEPEKLIDRSKQQIGIMPGGEVIVKRFGRWYYRDCNEYQRDDDGNPLREAFPEFGVAPTPEEFEQKFSQLPESEWGKLLCGGNSETPVQQLENRGSSFDQGLLE